MPRRNRRDTRFTELKEYSNQTDYYEQNSEKKKPVRRRKGQWDKKIYKDDSN